MAMRPPRSARSRSGGRFSMSSPSNPTAPPRITAFSGRRRVAAAISVDLPEPLSPTMPTMLPRGTSRLTWRSAETVPRGVRKSTLSLSIERIAAMALERLAQLGVEEVAQGLAEEGEAERRDDERQPPADDDPRRVADEIVPLVEEPPPARRRRRHAEAKEAQPGLQRDHHGDVHAGDDEQGADGVGHDVMEQYARRPRPERALGE